MTSEVGTPDGVGRTWRIYAQFDDENDELTSIFGTADHPMTLSSTNGFHQTPGGSALPEFDSADLASTPALGWDSWVTIGAENEPTEVNTLGLDLSTFEAGGDLGHDATFGGSWYVFPGESELAHPDAEGRVLIAQLTTTGIITAELNLQYRDQNNQAILVYNESLSFPSPNAGCMDPTACNFDAEATEEDGSCVIDLRRSQRLQLRRGRPLRWWRVHPGGVLRARRLQLQPAVHLRRHRLHPQRVHRPGGLQLQPARRVRRRGVSMSAARDRPAVGKAPIGTPFSKRACPTPPRCPMRPVLSLVSKTSPAPTPAP